MNEKRKGPADRPAGRAALDAAIAQLPADYTDAEFVVRGMYEHFGDLFTAEDEARVRELVKPKPTGHAVKVGECVGVLDWTRDPNQPVECRATVEVLNSDGTVDVKVDPPAGIEPYHQTGLREIDGALLPGQFKRIGLAAEPTTDGAYKPGKPGVPVDPVPPPGGPSH